MKSVVRILLAALLAPATLVVALPPPGEIEQLKSQLEQHPDAVKERYKLGSLYFVSERFDEAIEEWHRILANKQNGLQLASKVKLARVIAIAHFKSGRLDRAYKWIDSAYRKQPYDPKIQRARDVIKKAYDDWKKAGVPPPVPTTEPVPPSVKPPLPPPTAAEARQAFTEAEQLYSEGLILVEQASDLAAPEKKFGEAITRLQTVVRGDYQRPKALYLLGSSYLMRNDEDQHDLEAARDRLEESLALDDDKRTHINLAQTYGLLDVSDKQILHLEKAIELDPSSAECHFRLAMAFDKSGRKDAARKTFEHAKAAIRLKSEYKKKFQGVLKNSQVANEIAEMVTKIIKDSEEDALTESKTEGYAKQFQDMLGEQNLTTEGLKAKLKDKEGLKNLLKSDAAKSVLESAQGQQLQKLLSTEKGKQLQDRMLNPQPSPASSPAP